MTSHKKCDSVDWIEIKTLHRLITRPAPLKCNGSYWTHVSDPKLAIAAGTIRSLAGLGWIEPHVQQEGVETRDLVLTEKGKSAWVAGIERKFYERVERHIDWQIDKISPKKPDDEKMSGVYLADFKGIWISHS
jgi:hypothetical protein